ncbi:MAG: acyl-ACP--UDP-N-acetylglucosamine O-acyltransferase [Alphaproteobacteria bacterium]|nr:acyl-ACP--UDP-N-acetylglucosamine O-acyltransferase [Alphaproteobacteria bacterium]
MSKIAPTALIDESAQIGADVELGPYAQIGPNVVLDDGVQIGAHAVISRNTTIGRETVVHPFAVLGGPPQSVGYRGEETTLVIGARNVIREFVTINRGMPNARGETRIGDGGFIMTHAHIAHDCVLGDGVIMANNVMIGGHVHIGDAAWIGGGAAVHQNARIGRNAMLGGMAGLEGDLIPFGSALGNRAYLGGLNLVGLKRRGFSRETIHDIRNAYRLLFAEEGTFQERLDDVAETFSNCPEAMEIVEFIRTGGNRSLCMPHRDV